jgi:hypothetical protein
LPFEKAAINIKSTDTFSTCELWFEVFYFSPISRQPNIRFGNSKPKRITSTIQPLVLTREEPRGFKEKCHMTQSLNRQNLSIDQQRNAYLEVFDGNGHVDAIVTIAANAEIFSEANHVKLVGGGIDAVATAAKQLVTRAAIIARRK